MTLLRCLACWLLLVGAAGANEVPAVAVPTPQWPPAEVTIVNFGSQNPQCKAWTNACVLCLRTAEGPTVCSTPGIACTPVEISCLDPKEP